MSFPKSILVVENEKGTKRFLSDILTGHEKAELDFCIEYKGVLDNLKKKHYDLILIDVDGNTEIDGIDLAKMILKVSFYPIVFLSATNDRMQLQRILDLSPFGFLFKPFSSTDITISIQLAYHNYLKQQEACSKSIYPAKDKTIRINESYSYDMDNMRLYHNGEQVKLNLRQLRTIDQLCRHIGTVVSYENLSCAIWGEYIKTGSKLRTLIYTIRKKLPDLPLVSYSKVGYMLQSR